MEENINSTKISFVKNTNKLNFNSTLSIPIDANVNIKSILDVNTYLFDLKVECGNGKAIVSGKIGAKIVYIDTDNLTNSITHSQNFNETYLDTTITADCFLNVQSYCIENNILSTDGILKINCDVTISPIAYCNLGFNCELNADNSIITKKSEAKMFSISKNISTKFDYVSTLEIPNNLSKILCVNSNLIHEGITANNGYITIEGKLSSSILYEYLESEQVVLKSFKETQSFKYDIEIENMTAEEFLDVCVSLDKSTENISTEISDNSTSLTITNKILVSGVSMKKVSIELVDDMFSTQNEIEVAKSKRDCSSSCDCFTYSDVLSNEITIPSSEPAIDEIVANLNINPEVTNTYIKDNQIVVEGITTSNLIFIDENKEIQTKHIQTPFIFNTKIEKDELSCTHTHALVTDSQVKVKRGTIVEIEYTMIFNICNHSKSSIEAIDNYKLGSPLNNGNYDYQIYVAKPKETIWDLAKRIKISPDDLTQTNKNLPLIMEGGERVIIKR